MSPVKVTLHIRRGFLPNFVRKSFQMMMTVRRTIRTAASR